MGKPKLSKDDVWRIRTMHWAEGKPYREIAEFFQISGEYTGRLCRGEIRRDVPMPGAPPSRADVAAQVQEQLKTQDALASQARFLERFNAPAKPNKFIDPEAAARYGAQPGKPPVRVAIPKANPNDARQDELGDKLKAAASTRLAERVRQDDELEALRVDDTKTDAPEGET